MISIELYIPSMTDKEESRAEQSRWYVMVWYGMTSIELYIPSMTNKEQRRADGML